MEPIGAHIKQYKPTKENIRSIRDEQIANFYNKQCIKITDRKTKKLRLATKAELAIILRNWKTPALYPLFKECENANSFSKLFWWKVKKT